MGIEMSNEISKLAHALSLAQGTITSANKNKTNPHFKSKYADLDECWNVVREPLSLNGLSITQWPTAQGKTVSVETVLLHTSGQWIKSSLTLEARDATAQSIGGAITYGRRYGFSAAIGITADEDDDGNSAMPQTPKEGPKNPYNQHRTQGNASVEPQHQKMTPPPPPPNHEAAKNVTPQVFEEAMLPSILKIVERKADDPVIPYLIGELRGKRVTQRVVKDSLHDAVNKMSADLFEQSVREG